MSNSVLLPFWGVIIMVLILFILAVVIIWTNALALRDRYRSDDIIIGYAPYQIPIYKNTAYFNENKIIHIGKEGSKYSGLIYGTKYQCVEFVRRWLIHARNITFVQISQAVDLFTLNYATDITTHEKIPLLHIKNDGTNTPVFGDILVWKKEGINKDYGHVAIVTKVISQAIVTISEQNGTSQNGIRNVNVQHDTILGWVRPNFNNNIIA